MEIPTCPDELEDESCDYPNGLPITRAFSRLQHLPIDRVEPPKNGWMVVCMCLGKYIRVDSRETLATVVFDVKKEADRKFPNKENLVQVFELGEEVVVRLKVDVESIQIKR